MDDNAITFRATDISEIDLIRPLWEQLNEHHRRNAREFKDRYAEFSFEERKAYFIEITRAGLLRIDLAVDPVSQKTVGYCIVSLSNDRTGEIESIYIRDGYRSQGIGSRLMDRALAWFKERGSGGNQVSVAAGNEAVFAFYRRFNFFPRKTVLEQKRN